LYWLGQATPSLVEIASDWRGDGGIVPIVFYRALVQSGNTAPVDALVAALAARRLRPLPIYVQSLKDGEANALIAEIFAAHPPAVILNAGASIRCAPIARSCRSSSPAATRTNGAWARRGWHRATWR
jgi:cobaltochelatase CobN